MTNIHTPQSTVILKSPKGEPVPVVNKSTEVNKPTDFKKIESKISNISIDVAMAKNMLEKLNFQYNRPLDPLKVKQYAKQMKDGNWGDWSEITLAVFPDGKKMLLNGQHRLAAVIESKTACRFTVTEIPVKNDDEAGRIYATLDTCKTRSKGDSLRALLTDQLGMFNARQLTKLGSSVDYLFKSILKKDIKYLSVFELSDIIINNKFGELYNELTKIFSKSTKEVSNAFTGRASVTAICLALLKTNPIKAGEFLRDIAEEKTPVNTPAHSIRYFLTTVKSSGGPGKKVEFSHGEAKYIHSRAVLIAWNAFLRGESLKPMHARFVKDFGHSALKYQGNNYVI